MTPDELREQLRRDLDAAEARHAAERAKLKAEIAAERASHPPVTEREREEQAWCGIAVRLIHELGGGPPEVFRRVKAAWPEAATAWAQVEGQVALVRLLRQVRAWLDQEREPHESVADVLARLADTNERR